MKKSLISLPILSLSALLILSGCDSGDSGNSPTPGGNPAAYQVGPDGQRTDLCSSDFVLDYNKLHFSAESLKISPTQQNLSDFQSLVSQFGSKYTGVNCNLHLSSPDSLNGSDTYINVDQFVSQLQNDLNQAENPTQAATNVPQPVSVSTPTPSASASPSTGSSVNNDSPAPLKLYAHCTDSLVARYDAIEVEIAQLKTKDQVLTFLDHLKVFATENKGMQCIRESGDLIDVNVEVEAIVDYIRAKNHRLWRRRKRACFKSNLG